ncbi:MFS transporter [Chloroflexota bacterium]
MTSEDGLPSPKTGKPKIFYGYIIVAASFLIMVVMHGAYNTFGIFFTSLETEFGITRAVLSGAQSFAFVIMGISSIIAGILADRLGPRRVLTACAILFGAGFLLLSQAGSVWQLYLIFVLIGIGLSAPDIVPLTTVVRWFVRKRGTMSGIMKVGTGTGMTIMPLVASVLIANLEWRTSYIVIGAAILILVIPLAQLMRRDPREMGLLPDNEIKPVSKDLPVVEPGLTLREAFRTRQLWMVCGYQVMTVACGITLLTHIAPHAQGLGVPVTVAAGLVSVIGGFSIAGRLVMGFSGDKIGQKWATVICFVILIIALTWLQFSSKLWMLYVFAAIYGFNHGGFFALISPMVASLFGTRSHGTLLGIVIFCGTIGGSINLVVAGHIFDITGTYQIAFFIMLILGIIGLSLALFVKPMVKEATNDPAN